MNFEIISLIILICSFLGILTLVFRKIPALMNLPELIEKPSGEGFLLRLRNKIKNIPGLRSFSFEIFLQKIISQIRVLSLKTDSKTFNWLKKLREKNQKNKLENDNYWEELKNSTNNKNDSPSR